MKVLIVNDNLIGEGNAVGYAMKNMLLDMPDTEFLQYCVDYRPKEHIKLTDAIFCKETDSLSFLIKAALAKKKQKAYHVSTPSGKPAEQPKIVVQPSALPTGAGQSSKGELLRGIFYVLPCRVSKENIEIVKEFAPDVIYTLAENIRVIKFAIKLSKKLGIPIVYHAMDDWKETAYSGARYLKPFRRILFKQFEKMHKYSVENIAICEKMAKYYSESYGIPYTYACNCIQEYNEEGYTPRTDSMKLVFSGSLHLHRGEVLQEVAEVVEALNGEGYRIEMRVIAPVSHLARYRSAINQYPHVEWSGYGFPQKNKMEQLKQADVLLHAEARGESDVQYARYSFSTKLPEYFAIGRCVLAYGTKELASIAYVEEKSCGYVAENPAELKKQLISLYNNPAERAAFAERNFKLGKEHFSKESVQKTIYRTLRKSAEEYRNL